MRNDCKSSNTSDDARHVEAVVFVRVRVLTLQSQTLTVMSCWYPTETMKLLLVEKATHDTPYLWD